MDGRERLVLLLPILCACHLCGSVVWAQEGESAHDRDEFARFVSNTSLPFCALLAGYHLVSSAAEQRETGWRLADAILLSAGAAGLGKTALSASRPAPNDGKFDGMPSGHTTISFATAAVIAERKPRFATHAYGGAALVGWSRYRNRAHSWDQVLVGAALGTYIGSRVARGDWRIWGGRKESGLNLSFGEGTSAFFRHGPALQLEYRTTF
jgi:hypothetical protein